MPSDFAHCRKDRQMPTNTCPHCGTVCGSHIADEGHVLQSKECQRRELAALVNRVEQLTEQLAQKDAEIERLTPKECTDDKEADDET
jgi:leucyl-tRNA synthetase